MLEDKAYQEYVHKTCPKTKQIPTLIKAFVVGGIICIIGQAFGDLYKFLLPEFTKPQIGSLVSVTMIFLAALLTGLGIYDKIGKHAGAGSIVPITGFSNSIVSPAMEFNKEGVFYGIMAKMFVIAGPVIVSGVTASVLVGIIYYIVGLF